MLRTCLIAAVLGVAAGPAIAKTPDAPMQSTYTYFKQPRPLQLDPTRIAFTTPDSTPGAFSESAVQQYLGAQVNDVSPLEIPGWQVVSLDIPSHESDAVSINRRLDALIDMPSIDFVSPVFIGNDGGPVIVTSELLIRVEPTVMGTSAAEEWLSDTNIGDIIVRDWGGMPGAFLVRSNRGNGLDVLADANRVAMLPEVRFAEPNMMFTGSGTFIPNDQGFLNCWGLNNVGQFDGQPGFDIDGPEAWDVTWGDPGVIAVVIDVGVQQDHPDIHQNPGTDVTSDPSTTGGPVNSFDRHGTAVAGSITAFMNNGIGTVGVAPGCVTASARTFISIDANGKWKTMISWTVDALDWAQSIGARVTNNSNFYGFQSSAIADKYAETRAAGIVHFASAGNRAVAALEYPASLPSVLSVGAMQNTGVPTTFTNFGPDLDFVAPGQDIYTTDRTGLEGYISGNFVFLSGTSFSSAYAAGVAALFISTHPNASAALVEEALRFTSTDLGAPGRDDVHGWGMVNAAAAASWDGDCDQITPPSPESAGYNKNRYISFHPPTSPRQTAIRVEVTNAQPPQSALIGQVYWVGEPAVYVDSVIPPTTFTVAKLVCSPVYRDWTDVGLMHVTGPAIVPLASYAVQSIFEACDVSSAGAFSSPLVIATARWGDVAAPFNPPDPRVQPDFLDVAAIVDRFRSAMGAPSTSRTDLEPAEPNLSVSFADIAFGVDAFKGFVYPFPLPCPCGTPCP